MAEGCWQTPGRPSRRGAAAGLGPQAQAANALSGAYTINSAQPTAGTNFISFSDAATRLNNDGVSVPVTITVSGGPYTEHFLLGEAAGTSATNTLAVNGGAHHSVCLGQYRAAGSGAAQRHRLHHPQQLSD